MREKMGAHAMIEPRNRTSAWLVSVLLPVGYECFREVARGVDTNRL